LSVQLSFFKQKDNEEHILVDAGVLLYLLRHFASLSHKLRKKTLKLAITEQVIREVAEHLEKSLENKNAKGISIAGVQEGIKNFCVILRSNEIRKIADPKIPRKVRRTYEQYREDMKLAYVLFEGKFKGITTQDGSLIEKIPKEKIIPPQQLLK